MDDKTLFYYIFFKKCCIISKCLNNGSFLLQAMVFGRDPRPIELFVEIHMQNEDCWKSMQ